MTDMRKFILEMQSARYFQSLFCLKATFPKYDAKGQAPISSMLPNVHQQPGFSLQRWFKLGVVGHASNFSVWEVEANWSGVQGHPQLQNECKASLAHMRFYRSWNMDMLFNFILNFHFHNYNISSLEPYEDGKTVYTWNPPCSAWHIGSTH